MAKIERKNMTLTDSQGRVLREPRDNATGEAINFRWWTLDEKDMAAAIAATVVFIQRHQGSRMEQLVVSSRLYGLNSVFSTIGTAFSRASTMNSNPQAQRISFNICESLIDTLESKMAKNKILPVFITNGGDWTVQKRAKLLTKFAQGIAHQLNQHKRSIDAWGDGAVWGDGFIHIYDDEGKVALQREYPHNIFVDTIETINGPPRQLHRVRIMDRDICYEMWPELEEAIRTCSPANYQDVGGQGSVSDMVKVVESWHLKSGDDAKDGVHVISIGDGASAEPYEKDYFPFAHVRYAKRKIGWYGQGACERLQVIQGEINRTMMLKQRSIWMQGSFKVLLENGSKVVTQHLNNDVGAIIHYTGTPPQYVVPPATNPEVLEWVRELIQMGYQQEGMSKLAASGEVPLGVESGKAMRTLIQNSDDRFLFMQQEMEDFNLEITRQCIEVARDIYKNKKRYEAVFPSARFIETIDWKDIDLEEDEYVLKAYPTSSLSEDLTGRISEVQEMTQAGMISPRTAKRLMAMPDVEMNDNLSNAAEDLLHKILEQIVEDGIYRSPEPFMDLQLAQQLVLEYYNYADYMNAPNDRLRLLEQFNNQIKDMQIMAQAQLPASGGGGGQSPTATPQANPTPPPTSNLIQNVPGVAA